MEYRKLGKWGLKVSEIALGSWMTDVSSSAAAVETARQSVRRAYELGVNFFDCADAYSAGEAEVFLGKILREYPRSSIVLSSKAYFPVGPGPNDRGLSRKHLFDQVHRSLRNLQTEYLDLFFCHRFDPETPLEETVEALSDLVAQGKILYWGVSEWTGAQIAGALAVIERGRYRPLSVIQPQYNLFDRYIEHEIVELCEQNGIGITCFSPLSQGLLTGKYRRGQPIPEGSRATHQRDKQINRLLTEEYLDKVERLAALAQRQGMELSVLALAWALRLPQVSSLITGATRPEQIEKNSRASGIRLPEDVLAEIEEVSAFQKFTRSIG